MSNITLNIVEPVGPTPVDPGIDPVVPNTGLFTHGIGGPEATIIGAVIILTIAAIVTALLYRKHKKASRTTKLVHTIDTCKTIITSKRRVTAGLTVLALLVSTCTFITLAKNAVNATENNTQTNQAESINEESSLTVNVSDEELTIEVGDEPVFAVMPVEVTVEEATQAGYTLTAYADSTDLVSTTNPDNIIPMVTLPDSSVETLESSEVAGELTALTDNTYGLALGNEPTTKDDEVYTTLSTDLSNPTIIKSMAEYSPTEAEDKTTIYYAFYITPDIPYGTCTNDDSEVYYNATINTTLVTFDGNGLYFNNGEEQQQTTNEIEYIAVPQENNETETGNTINQIISGQYQEPSQSLPYNFLGWSTDDQATSPTYTSEQEIAESLPIKPNQPITLYAIWQKVTNIIFNSNDDTGTTSTQSIIAGESTNLNPNTFTREGYNFTGWNTEATPTEQTPGTPYADKAEYTAPLNKSQNLTLYAQWEKKLPVIGDLTDMQDFATLTEEDKASVLNSMTEGQQYQLEDSRDQKTYHISRLADENIWMTQNLDFDITNKGADLNSTNTDVPQDWEDAGKLTNTYSTGTTTWNGSNTEPESYDPGDLYWNGNVTTSGGNLSNRTTTEPSATYGTHYHVGNYYNWTAAVAMSDSSSYTTYQQDVNQSICPAGWRLPNLSENKSYQNLVNTQGLTAGASGNIQSAPTYFVYGGYWDGSSRGVGEFGYYWSSVVKYSDYTYPLYFDAYGYLGPQSSSTRNDGYSLRCVAR